MTPSVHHPAMPRIPAIPGTRVPSHSAHASWLRKEVSKLCMTDNQRFPGAQPISFLNTHFAQLEAEDFWVCEKSDGIRALLFVHLKPNGHQTVYLLDRHNDYYELSGLSFPRHQHPNLPLHNTIVDGELVYDVDPRTNLETLRFLAFDCLVVDGENIMALSLDRRFDLLHKRFHNPFVRAHHQAHAPAGTPFDIRIKQMQRSYGTALVFAEAASLEHDSDGLIYTRVNAPYTPSTTSSIIKWKPRSENSIDFRLVLCFPPGHHDRPLKPLFLLHVWCGGDKYEPYDELYVTDEEWEAMRCSGEQYHNRIIEARWDRQHHHWLKMRFRDDKPHANHKKTVENIMKSIDHGVEQHTLLERCDSIRAAWKARELRYGRLGVSRWSRVGGPPTVAGMRR
ncbi:mRNA-capping enzyme subunit alpha [Favolaschia claudopus]|uniref:mRNA guanylyltransferase n=1 Tax=Favolaschia claudopus TaxID=2862362 RepID=A0AAW0E0L5_9AGAR